MELIKQVLYFVVAYTTIFSLVSTGNDYDNCEFFNVTTVFPLDTTVLPSENVTIEASCSCDMKYEAYCPEVFVSEDVYDQISLKGKTLGYERNSCLIQATIKPLFRNVNRRSIQVPLRVYTPRKQQMLTFRFQQNGNGEACNKDVDCWHSKDQICDNGICACYQDVPIFINKVEKCVAALTPGERCTYDEQCKSEGENAYCDDESRRCYSN